jgi:heat-inducible transcriptional repressor
MDRLTDRQKLILTLVIHDYIRIGAPVGSNHLVQRYNLEMSSATVRNELAALTELGYLRQLHTSAGRIPSEEGYRYFVGRLIQETELPDATRRLITHQFYQTRHDIEEWMRLAASILAHQSRGASVVTAPHPEKTRLKHVELISTRGHQVLMIIVLVGGEIHQRLLTLPEILPQEVLSACASRITSLTQGRSSDEIPVVRDQSQGLDLEILNVVYEEITSADSLVSGDIFLDGLSNVLSDPEFSGSEDARRALRVLEEKPMLQDLLARTMQTGNVGGVQVLIGGEGYWEDLRQCSIVLARYGMPGLATGTLGVLGPLRMPYGRTISTVRFLAGLLSDMVIGSLAE